MNPERLAASVRRALGERDLTRALVRRFRRLVYDHFDRAGRDSPGATVPHHTACSCRR